MFWQTFFYNFWNILTDMLSQLFNHNSHRRFSIFQWSFLHTCFHNFQKIILTNMLSQLSKHSYEYAFTNFYRWFIQTCFHNFQKMMLQTCFYNFQKIILTDTHSKLFKNRSYRHSDFKKYIYINIWNILTFF